MRLQDLFASLLLAGGVAAAPADGCYPDEDRVATGFMTELLKTEKNAGQQESPTQAQLSDYLYTLKTASNINRGSAPTADRDMLASDYPDGFGLPGQDAGEYDFGLRLTGYLKAPRAGSYSLFVNILDGDAALLQIGAGVAAMCCQNPAFLTYDESLPNQHVYLEGGVRSPARIIVEMEAGVYYPISLVYYNPDGDAYLSLGIHDDLDDIAEVEIFHDLGFSPEACDAPLFSTTTITSTDSSISQATDVTVCPSDTIDGVICTVSHLVPGPTTLTITITQSRTDTTSITYEASGSSPASVVIEVPPAQTATTTITVDRTDTTTVTYEASGSAPGSLVIEVPPAQTATTTITVDRTDTTTVTFEASASQPGSVVIEVPPAEVVTTTITVDRTDTTTVTFEASASQPGSVVIEVPTEQVTSTVWSNNTETVTTTRQSSGLTSVPVSVVDEASTSYVTVTSTISSIIATTTRYVSGHGAGPATVVICVPPAGRKTFTITKPCPVCTADKTSYEVPQGEGAVTKWIETATEKPAATKTTKTDTLPAQNVDSKTTQNTISKTADNISTTKPTTGSTETSSGQPGVSVEPQVGSGSVFYAPSVVSLAVLVISALM